MAVQDKGEGKVGYEEFDSSEFEADQPVIKEVADDKGDEKDAEEETTEGKKLTVEEAFGGDDKEAATEEKTEDADKETPESKVAGQQEETPAYEPNHKYKVYDQEKDFPEPLKVLVKDKETEEYVRGLLSKADGLDEMKPRHQETVRERDTFKSQVDFYKNDINRVLTLRDKQPHLFAAELGITDDWIIKVARELVNAKETPEAQHDFNERRRTSIDTYNAGLEAQNQRVQAGQEFASAHQQQMNMALSHPDVASFQSQFDALHGLGSFQEEVRKHGYYHFEKTARANGRGENLSPMDCVKSVVEFHKKMFTPASSQGGTKSSDKTVATTKREAVKPIPNIGKGRNASPVGRRFKNLKEMRAYVDKNIES